MTVPFERTRAVNSTYDFLCDLLDPEKTPRVPKDIRRRASACLRHYPNKFDMDTISKREEGNEPTHMGIFKHKVFGNTF